jgi:gluconolactonase
MSLRPAWLLSAILLISGPAQSEDAAPAAATREVEAGDLKLTVPSTWKQQQPSNNLRLAQFQLPAVEGDKDPAELVISPPIGGTREANITRWVDQFEADGRELVMSQGKCAQGEYVLVKLTGTYKKPIGPPILRKSEPAPGYAMYGVMLSVTKDGKAAGNYFLKLTGPAKTVAASEDALRASIAADKAAETEYKLP